jgi:PAS domain S-box-containing protein
MKTADALRVILAGSSPADRQWVTELLLSACSSPCEFLEADTGEAALRQVQTPSPAHERVLLAGPLADMDAMGLLARLLDPQRITPCPVVVITPGNGRELGPVLLRAGAQDYIGEDWLSPFVLARAVDNARVRWAMERDLCERDNALQRSEAFARGAQRLTQTIIDGAGALVFAKDLQGHYFLTNRAWRERIGLTEEQAAGTTDEAVYGPDVARTLRQNDQQVLASGRLIVSEETTYRNGQPVHYLSSKFPLLDDAGRAYAVCGVSTDVTPLKQTQAALQARERELQTLADNTPAILVRFDRHLRHVFVSAAIERMTGRPPHAFIGRTPRELAMPEDLSACWENAIHAAFLEERPQAVAFSYQAPGGLRHFSGRFVPEFGTQGTIEHVLGVLHDDTEQKRAEEDINRLLEEERHYARLLARMAQASRQMHASLSTDEIAQVLTQQAREIIGARRAVTHLTLDGAGALTVQAVASAEDSPPTETPAGGTLLTAPLTGKNGQQVGLVQLAGSAHGHFTDEDKAVLVQLAAIASTGLENARLYASLREADHRKDEFLATLAHELRNPLAPIRNGLEILRRSGQLSGTAESARDMMDRQLVHLVRLVDDLLDVSRISRGKVDLRLARITLQSVLDHALESSRPAIEASGHQLELHLPQEPLWVEGDLTRLAQVVSNLLNNAAKYTPAGGRIEVRAQSQEGRAVIQVVDNGTGICADMLPRVFDLFAQVDRTLERSQGGLGIGLSLVKKLVELHGGDICAESEGLSQGSRFTVRLPLAAAPGAPAMPVAAGTGHCAKSAPPCRVLVCDDNVDGAESLALMLGLLGHEVRTVHDGPQALAAVAGWRPDVALLDIGLPGLSGYEVAQRLRQDPTLAGLVLVAVTGWGTEDDQRRSAQAGFDHHLTKPVEAAALEAVLARRGQTQAG